MANTPIKGLQKQQLNGVFSEVATKLGYSLKKWQRVPLGGGSSIASDSIIGDQADKITGVLAFDLLCLSNKEGDESEITVPVVLKSKGGDSDLINSLIGLGFLIDETLGKIYAGLAPMVLGGHCMREVCSAQAGLSNELFKALLPTTYLAHKEPSRDVYYIVMERFSEGFKNIDALEGGKGLDAWDETAIRQVLSDIALFHAGFLGKTDTLPNDLKSAVRDMSTGAERERFPNYIPCLLDVIRNHCPETWTHDVDTKAIRINDNIGVIRTAYGGYPKTFCHGDFSPRNVCLKPDIRGQYRACAYDWELSCIHVPQRDLAEFLLFALPANTSFRKWEEYIEFYRNELINSIQLKQGESKIAAVIKDKDRFIKMVDFAVMEYLLIRIPQYIVVLVGIKVMMPFLPRLIANSLGYLNAITFRHDFL